MSLFEQKRGNFEVRFNENLIKTFDDVEIMMKDQSCQLIDARTPGHFAGKLQEPSPGL